MSLKTVFCCVLIVFFVSGTYLGAKTNNNCEISLTWVTGSINPFGVISLASNDVLTVKIFFPDDLLNYEIVISGIKAQEVKKIEREKDILLKKEEYTQAIIHDSDFVSYQIVATRRSMVNDTNPYGVSSRTWVIPVRTEKWEIAFSGGFLGLFAEKPEYYLQAGKYEEKNGDEVIKTEDGFLIRKNEENSENFSVNPITMVHLYHPRLRAFSRNIFIVPISVGIGFNSDLEVKYCLGAGLKFGNELFLTFGASLASINRLPNQYSVFTKTDSLITDDKRSFTSDNNALNVLDKANRVGFFFSLTYTFLSSQAKNKFLQPFTSSTENEKPGDQVEKKDPFITEVKLDDKKENIIIKGENLGEEDPVFSLSLSYKLEGAQNVSAPQSIPKQKIKYDKNGQQYLVPFKEILKETDEIADKKIIEIAYKITRLDNSTTMKNETLKL